MDAQLIKSPDFRNLMDALTYLIIFSAGIYTKTMHMRFKNTDNVKELATMLQALSQNSTAQQLKDHDLAKELGELKVKVQFLEAKVHA